MNVRTLNERAYRLHRNRLNSALEQVRQREGLGAALTLLVAQQLDAGFIEDDLKSVRRYRVYHPTDRERSFLLQHNVRRALRHAGAGRSSAPAGVTPVHGGCFLCPENVAWQQRGIEVGYRLALGGRFFNAYANPFPLMPAHVTVAAERHVPQGWDVGDGADEVRTLVAGLVELAGALPGFVVFFNGPGAGASIPSHLHYQAFQRPFVEPFPLEAAAPRRTVGEAVLKQYPITCGFFEGPGPTTAARVSKWLELLLRATDDPTGFSVNLIATSDGDQCRVHVVPRHQSYSYAQGMAGLVGGLEILGELVLSTEAEKQELDRGQFSYQKVADILAAVEPPQLRATLRRMSARRVAVRSSPTAVPEGSLAAVLAVGGEGTRWEPNQPKHLDAIFDKPMVFYLVDQLMLAGARHIMVVCHGRNREQTEQMFEAQLIRRPCGAEFAFCTAPRANGPASVFMIPDVRQFVRDRSVALMLDGVYVGGTFASQVQGHLPRTGECVVLAASVSDPTPFGWLHVDPHTGELLKIVEKPNFLPAPGIRYKVQTHMYFYGPDVVSRAERLPLENGELGVSALHTSYLRDGKLRVIDLEDGQDDELIWDDAGTPEKRARLTQLVADRQARTGGLVGSPHLTGLRNGWVSKTALAAALKSLRSEYWKAVRNAL